MKVRIKFAKYGSMKFIGHLDTMLFFQKAVRRAGIDVKYSEGFSPHQIMSFAAPLGVGIESMGEYMDIGINTMTTPEEMCDALNRTMVEGVKVLSVNVLPDTAKNAMASVTAASYLIHLKEGGFDRKLLEEKAEAFYAQKTIPYTKETKRNVIDIDLKQGIYAFFANEVKVEKNTMSAVAAVFDEENTITVPCIDMKVNASSSGNIKPSAVFDSFCGFAGMTVTPAERQITRVETFFNNMQSREW